MLESSREIALIERKPNIQEETKENGSTVWKACAYGDHDNLKKFIDQDPSCISQPDEQGYYPLQWAALNNQTSLVSMLLENGADPNIRDLTGQTALHWSAVRGSLPSAETLLRAGARADIKDNRGYMVCHVAAQYGQTAVIYHLALRWNVDIGSTDFDGRSALHWAAYKGFADTVRLLLVLNANPTEIDKEGCTPLHWAAIRGNSEVATILLQGGGKSVLQKQDHTGCTPSQLAFDKGHRHLGLQLLRSMKSASKRKDSCFNKNSIFKRISKLQLAPIIWMIIIMLVFTFIYKVILAENVFGPMPLSTKVFSWTAVLFSQVGLIFLYKTTTADPGTIPVGRASDNRRTYGNSTSEDNENLNLDSPVLWAGNWNQLCVTCKIVRPLRAKHCQTTGRCIEVFDHYCPWVGNAIGKGNRHFFIIFLWLELVAMVTALVVAIMRVHSLLARHEKNAAVTLTWVFVFIILDVFVGISVAALAFTQLSQALRNITTNEIANWYRYRYLHGTDGRFQNPFDKGLMQNFREVCLPSSVPRAPVSLDMITENDSLLRADNYQV